MRIAFFGGLIIALIAAGVYYEISAWQVCLKDSPWWYCLKVLSK